jgi:hypothetical protein
MAYDAARRVTVLFGGEYFDGQYHNFSDTWTWSGSAWEEKQVFGPSARTSSAMAYDAARGVVVLFGGYSHATNTDNDETWEWDGVAWTQRGPFVRPSARHGHAMAYDAGRGVVVLFGGTSSVVSNAETWEWNGSIWVRRCTNCGPSPRYYLAMAHDSVLRETVLFGGAGDNNARNDETWAWNEPANAWTQRHPEPSPSPRNDHAMAYDIARERIVLFGGGIPSIRYGDTWDWNGSGAGSWSQRPIGGPSARNAPAMAYDTDRRVTVLFGGFTVGSDAAATWELTPCLDIIQSPRSQIVAGVEDAVFTCVVRGGGPFVFEWQKRQDNGSWIAITPGGRYCFPPTGFPDLCGPVPGNTLIIRGTVPNADSGTYRVRLTGPCGDTFSQLFTLNVLCPADYNGDGVVDFFDYLDFVAAFDAGCE